MSTEINAQEEARRIWESLDREDAGEILTSDGDDDAGDGQGQGNDGTAKAAPESGNQNQGTTQQDLTSTDAEDDDELPQKYRDMIAGLSQQVEGLSARLRSAEGNIGGLKSNLKTQLEAAKSVAQAGGDAPTTKEITNAQASPEAFAALERDYPEFAKALKPAVAGLEQEIARLRANQNPQAPDLKQETTQVVTREEMQQLRAEIAIEARHPGWQKTVQTPEFIGWLSNAPREVQMLAASDEPEDAIRLLDLRAQAISSREKPQSREVPRSIRNASSIPTGRRSMVATKNVDDMTPEEYWRHLDKLDEAKKA